MEAQVSFTQQVKEEIVTKPFVDERLRSILASFIKVNGVLSFSSSQSSIILQTENAHIAKFIYKILQKLYGVNARFSYERTMKFEKKNIYKILVEEKVDEIIDDLDISFLDGKISKKIVSNDETIGGYLSGAFLASGSVNSPQSSNYHLEISLFEENYAKWFTKLISHYKYGSFSAKIIKRRNQYVVYLKRSDQIADFLILLGATDASLQFENIRLDRDFSNIGNRLQICDTANFNKTMDASKKQIDDIAIIDSKLGIKNIANQKVRLLCEIRLNHEEATMAELAKLLEEETQSPVSKSNINHLFRSLHEMASRYKGEK